MGCLEGALDLARLGLRIVPLHHIETDASCFCREKRCVGKRRGKHPRECDWPEKATTDPDAIRRWFEKWPPANIGIATGKGILVLDVDHGAGDASLVQMQRDHNLLPETAQVRTGSGGRHYYFRVPEGVAILNTAGTIEPGIDIRAERGQAVAPPSRHYSGNPYRWVRRPSEGIADCPDWLLQRILGAATPRKQPRRGPSLASDATPDAQGGPMPPDKLRACRKAQRNARRPIQADRGGEAAAQQLLGDMVQRFVITGPGTRYGLMVRAVGSLLGCGIHPETARRVLTGWLEAYRGSYEADEATAGHQLDECINDTLRNETFQTCSPADTAHWGRKLTPLQESFLRGRLQDNWFIRLTRTSFDGGHRF